MSLDFDEKVLDKRTGRPRPKLVCSDGMTKQSHKDECDINKIVAKVERGGLITHVANKTPTFGVAPMADFKQVMDLMVAAETEFAALPAEARKRFGNDVGQLMDYLADPENHDEAREMGLLLPDEPVVPMKVEVTNQVPPVDKPVDDV